jgi:autotransporter-associated beta strand protein
VASRDHATIAPPALVFACVNPVPLRPAFLAPRRAPVQHPFGLGRRRHQRNRLLLERSAGGGEFLLLQTLPADTTNVIDDATQPDTAYAYRVRAVNAAGTSAWSSVATLATPGAFQAWGTVWDAGGLVSYFSWGLNWDLDQAPPFDGTTPLNFASSGTVAQVNTEARASGISLHSSEPFTLLDGNGSLIVGAGGIRAYNPNSETSLLYTIASDMTLAADQAWGVTNNGAGLTTLLVTGPVQDGDAAFGLTKTGDGRLVLAGDSTYDGVTRITDGSVLVQHDHAFGSAVGGTLVEGSSWLEPQGRRHRTRAADAQRQCSGRCLARHRRHQHVERATHLLSGLPAPCSERQQPDARRRCCGACRTYPHA